MARHRRPGAYRPEMADRLESALNDAGVGYRAQTYPAVHDWVVPDLSVHDDASA